MNTLTKAISLLLAFTFITSACSKSTKQQTNKTAQSNDYKLNELEWTVFDLTNKNRKETISILHMMQ